MRSGTTVWKACAMFRIKRDEGLTLLEVLLSIVMAGLVVCMVLNLYIQNYRLAEDLQVKTELDYALLRAGQVLTAAVEAGEKVEWTGSVLQVTDIQDNDTIVDLYYLADKDADGIVDLYREHLSVPNPVVSGLAELNCIEIDEKLWEITIRAERRGRECVWERTVRQK